MSPFDSRPEALAASTPLGTSQGKPFDSRPEALAQGKHLFEPAKQGLYDPRFEHDACGVGFVVDLQARASHDVVAKAIQVLLNLEHRGACGCETNTGDGAGLLLQTPHCDAYCRLCAVDSHRRFREASLLNDHQKELELRQFHS